MTIQQQLSSLFGEAFSSLGADASFGETLYSNRPELSQFQCNGALAAAKILGKNPREIAEAVIEKMTNTEIFANLSIAGPGFINVTLTDAFLVTSLQESSSEKEHTPRKIIIDFGGPNVAKPLGVNHLRSFIIGDSLQRIHRFLGNNVISDIHFGDWGTQMGMLICEIRREQPNLPYFDPETTGGYPTEPPVSLEDLVTLYPQGSARCKDDPIARKEALQATAELQSGRPGYRALWQHFLTLSVTSVKADLSILGIEFDLWNGESNYNDLIPKLIDELKEHGLAEESEGALVIRLDPKDGKDTPPMLLQKSDGAFLYSTTDFATIADRVRNDNPDAIFYVVDQRQHFHFKQVFEAARKTSIAPKSVDLEFLGFGTMNGSDGKPFKTRTGGAMRLSEFIEDGIQKAQLRMNEAGMADTYPEEEKRETAQNIALAAIKFADLSNNRTSDYIFNLDNFVSFEGKTGPYLVYTAVRISSIFQKIGREPEPASNITATGDLERPLLLELTKMPSAIQSAATENMPHLIAEQLFQLAQEFNRFYQNCNISKQTDPTIQSSWLAIAEMTRNQLTTGLSLLGIAVPHRM